MGEPAKSGYQYVGAYDHTVFQIECIGRFSGSSRYNAAALPRMMELLGLIERDSLVTDVRWVAYMLATVMLETTTATWVERMALNKKGKPLHDKKGKPVMVRERRWLMTMAPVEEVGHGKGRRYHEPVKVKQLADGGVRITEQDGDQFKISGGGTVSALTRKAAMGTTDGGPVAKAYDDDDGVEQAYFGRGYVQLTWWAPPSGAD